MLRAFLEGLKEIIYPKVCLVCKAPLKDGLSIDEVVCQGCWQEIRQNRPPFCHCCGRHLEKTRLNKNICGACVRKRIHFDRAYSPCQYLGSLKELIHAFKYAGKDYLAKTLSRPMVEFIKEYSLPLGFIDLVIPVPLHPLRLKEREFNQAESLAGYIAREFNRPVDSQALLRLRQTRSQTGLQDEERFANVRGSFRVKEGRALKGKNILLIDDVLTTGATASEASFALKESGAQVVFVLTLAN